VIDARTNTVRSVRTRDRAGQPAARPEHAAGEGVRPAEKTEAVLDILRGETSASAVALRFDVDRAEVQRWIDEFLRAGQGALGRAAGTGASGGGNEVSELRSMVRELADELATLRSALRDRR